MTLQPGMSQRNWLIRTTFVSLATLAFANVWLANARGADLAEQAHSLKKVPADASFYSASLRFKEQWHTFLESKAYAKLMEIPLVQMAKMQVTFQWQQSEQPTIAKVREYVQSPAGQDAVAVLKEMFSDEVFVYGGSDIAEIDLKCSWSSIRCARTAPLEAVGRRRRHGKERKITIDRMLEILDKHSDKLKVPTMVFGFRIKDQARAKRELDEVHSLIRNLLDQHQPELAAHLQRDQIAGHEFSRSGSMAR